MSEPVAPPQQQGAQGESSQGGSRQQLGAVTSSTSDPGLREPESASATSFPRASSQDGERPEGTGGTGGNHVPASAAASTSTAGRRPSGVAPSVEKLLEQQEEATADADSESEAAASSAGGESSEQDSQDGVYDEKDFVSGPSLSEGCTVPANVLEFQYPFPHARAACPCDTCRL